MNEKEKIQKKNGTTEMNRINSVRPNKYSVFGAKHNEKKTEFSNFRKVLNMRQSFQVQGFLFFIVMMNSLAKMEKQKKRVKNCQILTVAF